VPKLLLCVLGSLSTLFCLAQKDYGVHQDYYLYQNDQGLIVPLVYYQTKNNWYASLKYNYEEERTLSLQIGKKFSKEGTLSYSITPLAGVLSGNYKGVSLATEAELELGKFSFSIEPKYCMRLGDGSKNFLYNWSELSIQPSGLFYTGLAFQLIKNSGDDFLFEPGLLLGITIKNVELPFYFFRPSATTNYFVAGIHWRLKK
jgi:hypothetical protein